MTDDSSKTNDNGNTDTNDHGVINTDNADLGHVKIDYSDARVVQFYPGRS